MAEHQIPNTLAFDIASLTRLRDREVARGKILRGAKNSRPSLKEHQYLLQEELRRLLGGKKHVRVLYREK